MLGKNEVVLSSTLYSPSSFAQNNPEASLGYKSSISDTSQSQDESYPHGYSYSTFNRNPQTQPITLTLILQQNTYDIDCHLVFAFKRQLLKIFSVCGLNYATRIALKMMLVNKIMEFNPSFYQLLSESMQEYEQERQSAMLTSHQQGID